MATRKNQDFCSDLRTRCGTEVDAAERQLAEAELGSGAIRYKLNPAGLRHLFKSLSQDDGGSQGQS
ncbi:MULTISPECIES: hypothetical protein [unclassified Phaeobacter]|uniref:hypothetical protein n=1 Tax=unclassified Phaeobacter TaxID=2621772 RepID=UPI003A85B081